MERRSLQPDPGGLVAGELQQTLQRQGAAALPRRRKYWWQAWRIGGNARAAKLTPKTAQGDRAQGGGSALGEEEGEAVKLVGP